MERETCICAMDPGLSGAIAFYFPTHNAISAEHMPVVDGEVSASLVANRLDQMRPDVVVIERVASRPKQGVASSFKFGRSFGVLIGIAQAMQIETHLIPPHVWKRHFGLSSDKEESRARALLLWPMRADLFARKKDEARAEAALLALFYATRSARNKAA